MEWIALASAFWLGLLTSISPCPLATNIAAVSYIGRQVQIPGRVMASGIAYTLGRMLTYLILGVLLTAGIAAIPASANFLQRYMNMVLGPLLIVIGLILLETITFSLPGSLKAESMQRIAQRGGVWGAGLLGMLFALTFCPVSAALFFGSLIPLALTHHAPVTMPAVYGVGTGLPVMAFAGMLAIGTRSLGRAFDVLTRMEWWAQRITGVVFIGVGGFYCLRYIFGVV